MVVFWQLAVGLMVSSTVTVAVHEPLFPALSVTVKVTMFAPIWAQAKLLGLTVIEAIPLLELDPLSTWDALITTVPDEPR